MTPEQTRIRAALHQGCSSVPAERPVTTKAGDVLAVIEALDHHKQRADDLQAQLAAAQQPTE